MDWSYIEPLKNEENIFELERKVGFRFPSDIKLGIKNYNAGRPNKNIFDTKESVERIFGYMLNFNEDGDVFAATIAIKDLCNDFDMPKVFLPFAETPFGDLICYNNDEDNIQLVILEDGATEYICDTFDELLEKLYEESSL